MKISPSIFRMIANALSRNASRNPSWIIINKTANEMPLIARTRRVLSALRLRHARGTTDATLAGRLPKLRAFEKTLPTFLGLESTRMIRTDQQDRRVAGSAMKTVRTRPTCPMRSEEHTSELQSLRHLVCRLL